MMTSFLLRSSGGDVKNLTADNPGGDRNPVFSPDSKTIAYALERKDEDRPDYARLAILDPATGKSSVLTEGWENSVSRPAWTADGTSLVFEAESRARTNIYAVATTGGHSTAPLARWPRGRA